jgi:integrase
MKARREHRVPITEEMRNILARMKEWREAHRSDLIFASPNKFQILTDVSVAKTLKRYSKPEATPHGLRSSFKDWSTEEGWDDYLSEQQLAHRDRNKVRSAYRRSDVFEGRRAMMRAWTDFLT